jgi:hypothetical protein
MNKRNIQKKIVLIRSATAGFSCVHVKLSHQILLIVLIVLQPLRPLLCGRLGYIMTVGQCTTASIASLLAALPSVAAAFADTGLYRFFAGGNLPVQ